MTLYTLKMVLTDSTELRPRRKYVGATESYTKRVVDVDPAPKVLDGLLLSYVTGNPFESLIEPAKEEKGFRR